MDTYDLALAVMGLAALGVALLPRLLTDRPVSFPILYVGLGMGFFLLPHGIPQPDPLFHREGTERLAELGVIVALMGAGLKLDRRIGWRAWSSTWRLLAVTMTLTIAISVLLGSWLLGLGWPAAMLLGAVMAPTDPVLASDVQVAGPGGGNGEVRFTLTSEAGLNDGLAFPFTNAAILMSTAGIALGGWVGEWLAIHVVYKISVGVIFGVAVGWVIARLIFGLPTKSRLAESSEGLIALAATLLTYGVTELAGGYGFLAVFFTAVALRDHERHHDYHQVLHDFSEQIERLITAVILVLFGGALAGGLLAALTWEGALFAVVFVLAIRPVTGALALLGGTADRKERSVISFYGIRGVGSFYYVAHGINEGVFAHEASVWATVAVTVLLSIVVHGLTAKRAMDVIERG